MVANSPVIWQSKLQTETALLTMEAEVVAFVACCRELFPILDIVGQVGKALNMDVKDGCNFHVRMHEDNIGALTLLNTKPPQCTPCSKHYAIKTNCFREQILHCGIKVLKIDTKEQLGDIFTKSLSEVAFKYLCKRIMGW